MPLEVYRAPFHGAPSVTVVPRGFVFSAAANNLAGLGSILWMRVYTDSDHRIVVFEAVSGHDKGPDMLKLGLTRQRMDGNRRLTAKGLIANTPWIQSVAAEGSTAARKFELKPYVGSLPPVPNDNRVKSR